MIKGALCFITYSTDKCTGRRHCESTSKDDLPDSRGSLANEIPPCTIQQANQKSSTRGLLFITCMKPSIKRIVISVYLNSMFIYFCILDYLQN